MVDVDAQISHGDCCTFLFTGARVWDDKRIYRIRRAVAVVEGNGGIACVIGVGVESVWGEVFCGEGSLMFLAFKTSSHQSHV